MGVWKHVQVLCGDMHYTFGMPCRMRLSYVLSLSVCEFEFMFQVCLEGRPNVHFRLVICLRHCNLLWVELRRILDV